MLLNVLKQQKRFFWRSTSCMKQPPHDRQRYRRKFQEPRHSLPYYDEDPLERLPEKPVIIDGLWGSIDPKLRLMRFKHGEELKSIPTTFDKFRELYHLEDNLWFHSLDLPLKHPEMLEFVQFISRTILLGESFEYPQHPKVVDSVCYALSEELMGLNRQAVNLLDLKPTAVAARSKQRCRFISSLMEAVYRGVVSAYPDSQLATQANQIDERATIENFVKRFVDRSVFSSNPDERLDEDLYESVNETILDRDDCVRYRIRGELAWQLRGPSPLFPFVALEDPLCSSRNKVPQCNYRPEAFELEPVNCFSFECTPQARNLHSSEFVRTMAGYWSETPFWPGDPCEFGLLGVLDAQRSEQVRRDLKRSALPGDVQDNVIERHALAEAVITAFACTSAQAYNQGFTLYNELTYPIAAQLLIVDGDNVQLLRYQLNSLTGSWKPDDAGLPVNVAWFSPRLRLFELPDYSSSPCQVLVNPTAVSLLANALLQPVNCDCPTRQLRPFCPPESLAPRDQLCPGGGGGRLLDQPRHSLLGTSGLDFDQSIAEVGGAKSVLTPSEEEALKESLKGNKSYARRLFTPGKPHPNEVFFYKLTEKADIVEEIKEAVPSFGGRFGRLPAPHHARLREYKIGRRNALRKHRVEAPPRRWR